MEEMGKDFSLDPSLVDEMWVRAMAQEMQRFLKGMAPEAVRIKVDSEAVRILSEIKKVLDDKSLDDSECFCRVNAIVDIFYQAGLSTRRHEECE